MVCAFDPHPIRKERSLERYDVASTNVNIISTQRVGNGVHGTFVKISDIALYIAPV